jgi:hypothetical protein
MSDLIPDIDENIPLPVSAKEACPVLAPHEEIEMRACTAKLLADLTGNPLEPSEEHRGQAKEIMNSIVSGKTSPDLAHYPNETLAYLGGMVAMYDGMVVRDFADLKVYVVNRLLQETEHPDGKVRLAAIKALGDVDGVDAFKKRTEVTHKVQSIDEVEEELRKTLEQARKLVAPRPADIVDVEAKAKDDDDEAESDD